MRSFFRSGVRREARRGRGLRLTGGRTPPPRTRTLRELERLDDRILPSNLAIDAAGNLTYAGTAGQRHQLTISWTGKVFSFQDTETINVLPGLYGQYVTGGGTNHVTVDSSFGLKWIEVARGAGPGTDLVVDDSADTTGRNGAMLGNSSLEALLDLAPAPIGWDPAESLSVAVRGGSGGNAFYLFDTPAGVPLSLQAGSGPNTVDLGVGDVGRLQSPLTLSGSANTSVLADDHATGAGAVSYRLAAGSLSRSGAAAVSFTGVAALTVQAGPGNDTLLADYSGGDPIPAGGLTFNGGGGTNALTVDDSGDSTGRSVTVNNFSIGAVAGGGPITFANAQAVKVKGGSGGNTFNVPATPVGVAFTVQAGSGADKVVVGVGDLSAIAGPVNVITSGSTSVTADDHLVAGNSPLSYKLTFDSVNHVTDLVRAKVIR